MTLIHKVPGLEVRPVRDATELLAARQLHAACYLEAEYVDEGELDSAGLIDDPWVPYSDYFVACSEADDQIVGTARIIRPSVRGFPAVDRFKLLPEVYGTFEHLDPNLCMEISALATCRRGMQNTAIATALYARLARESVSTRKAYVFAVMDARLLRIMRRWFLLPFEPIGEPVDYMGEITTPVAVYMPRVLEIYKEQQASDVFDMFTGGLTFSELDDLVIDLRSHAGEPRQIDDRLDVDQAHLS